MWSQKGLAQIINVKTNVLKKKIVLNLMITYFSKYDKVFNYFHMFVALSTPAVAFVDKLVNNSIQQTSTVTLVLSTIVASMIKFKEYLEFDKIKDISKQQTLKYDQLLQHIEREFRKPENNRQLEDEFLYTITREYTNIDLDDPEIPISVKNIYIKFCKSKNIAYDDDIAALDDLLDAKINQSVKDVIIELTDVKEIKNQIADNSTESKNTNDTINNSILPQNQSTESKTLIREDNLQASSNSISLSVNSKEQRTQQKQKKEKLDTREDLASTLSILQSTINRVSDL